MAILREGFVSASVLCPIMAQRRERTNPSVDFRSPKKATAGFKARRCFTEMNENAT
jgi:hypothetical protein